MLKEMIPQNKSLRPKTIRDFINYTTSRFKQAHLYYGHGTNSAPDEAFYLITSALQLPADFKEELLDTPLTSNERKRLFLLIDKRINERIPTAYLTHQAWFAHLPFYVDERVIIPRSPLAELIENEFSPWIKEDQVHRILDLCTGSACIAIASALMFPDAIVDAVDISSEALEVARINVDHYQLQSRVHLIHSDLFQSLPASTKYDIIISNPPYVDESDIKTLPKEYQHEPSLALAGGKTGLDIVFRILKSAEKYLTSHGILVVEVGNSESTLTELLPNVPFVWLEFERGGKGVFLLTAKQLKNRGTYDQKI